jgi:hypothetical protein
MTLTVDFSEIKTDRALNELLVEGFNLPAIIGYGYNLSAFWDFYSYLDNDDVFLVVNSQSVTDPALKQTISAFIEILEDLRGTNPHFSFEIIS